MENHFTTRPWRSALLGSMIMAVTITLLLAGNLLAAQEFISDARFAPQLGVSKQVNRAQAEPGDTLAYTVVVDNTGGDSGNVILTDTLPAGLNLQLGTVISTPQQAIINEVAIGNNMISMTAIVGSGGMITLQFDAVVEQSVTLGTILTNTAWLTGTGEMLTDTAVTLVTEIVDLNLDKAVAQPVAEPGSMLDYTIRITNTSNEFTDFADVIVTDTLPAALLLQTGTVVSTTDAADVHSLMLDNNTIILNGTLAGGGWISLHFNAGVSDTVSLGTTVTNTALATSAGNYWSDTVTTFITNVAPITQYVYLPLLRVPIPMPTIQVSEPDDNNSWIVSWNPPTSGIDSYELQEAYDADFTNNLQSYFLSGNNTSRVFQYPSPNGSYFYRLRAIIGEVKSPWSNVVSVNIFPELTLSATSPDSDNEWTVSWTGGTDAISYYELQEATDPDFTENLQSYNTGTSSSQNISHIRSADNLYYYRVRSFIGSSASSWSDTLLVVGAYKDTFLTDATNWDMRRTNTSNYNVFYRPETDEYQMELGGTSDYIIVSPMAIGLDIDYEIEFEGRLVNPEEEHTLGIVFGGDWNGDECPDPDDENCFNQYYVLRIQFREDIVAGDYLEFKLMYIEGHDSNNQYYGETLIDWVKADAADPDDWNVWQVKVESDGDIKISLDDTRLASVRDSDLVDRLGDYFGFWGQTKDDGSLKIRFDDIAFKAQ